LSDVKRRQLNAKIKTRQQPMSKPLARTVRLRA